MTDDTELHDLQQRVESLEDRVDLIEAAHNRTEDGIAVGDTVLLVVQEADRDEGDDPIAYCDGTVTFLKTDGETTLAFGDTVRAKIADIQDRSIFATVMNVVE